MRVVPVHKGHHDACRRGFCPGSRATGSLHLACRVSTDQTVHSSFGKEEAGAHKWSRLLVGEFVQTLVSRLLCCLRTWNFLRQLSATNRRWRGMKTDLRIKMAFCEHHCYRVRPVLQPNIKRSGLSILTAQSKTFGRFQKTFAKHFRCRSEERIALDQRGASSQH